MNAISASRATSDAFISRLVNPSGATPASAMRSLPLPCLSSNDRAAWGRMMDVAASRRSYSGFTQIARGHSAYHR